MMRSTLTNVIWCMSATYVSREAFHSGPLDLITSSAWLNGARSMPPKAKRSRSAAGEGAVAKDQPKADSNDAIAAVFDQLKFYEAKLGNKFAGVAYDKVAKAIRAFKSTITSGNDLKAVAGVGEASRAKIDEFLTTGTVSKLEEFKKLGDLPAELVSAAGKVTTKSKGDGGKGKVGDVVGTPLTSAQKSAIKSAAEKMDALSVEALKAMLRANDGLLSGGKSDLVQRCAEGKVLGALPRCPLCSAGKLKFDSKSGIYNCPGYMDDDKWAPCFFKSGAIDRRPWVM
jgi:hypothetical protein